VRKLAVFLGGVIMIDPRFMNIHDCSKRRINFWAGSESVAGAPIGMLTGVFTFASSGEGGHQVYESVTD